MAEYASTAIEARIDCDNPANQGFLDFLAELEAQTIFKGGAVVQPDEARFTLSPDQSESLVELGFDNHDVKQVAEETLQLALQYSGETNVYLNAKKPFKIVGAAQDQLALRIEPRAPLVAARAAIQGYYRELFDVLPQQLQGSSYVLLGTVSRPMGFNKIRADLQHPIARRIPLPLIMKIGGFELA